MPSFDIVSEVDDHEVTNAVDQANREVTTRFDFKGVDAKFEYANNEITLTAPNEFQVDQMRDILNNKCVKRNVDIQSLEAQDIQVNGSEAKQILKVKQGIETDAAKKIIKLIKAEKLKVQTAIQGEKIRVTGKKRDDLQTVIAFLKEQENLELPLQFENFRD
jgi:uncharacterized protein YajQ (UPF0234 family)